MKTEARQKRNARIYEWAAQGMNGEQIARMLGKRYKLTANQVRMILKQKGQHETK